MGAFAVQQDQMRRAVESTMGTFIPPSLQEVGRQNMAMMERAMSLFSPFLPGEPEAPRAPASPQEEEIAALRREVDLLRKQLAEARLAGKKE
jgi:polyhydroxyalkanoate synthesis regulator protein